MKATGQDTYTKWPEWKRGDRDTRNGIVVRFLMAMDATIRRALGFKARCVCPVCGQGTITVID